MSAITMETSYVNSDGDMGQEHIDSHAKQHDYLMTGEHEIIVLSDTKLEEKSQDLALKKAITQGVKTEEEWKEYNSKLMPSRQKKSYQEYVKSLSNNYTKNIQRQLDRGTLTHAKKDKNYQSLKAIERNGGLAVEGNLYYLGNVDDYEGKTEKELKKYREFQAETFKRFYHSDIFNVLNKGCFRAEIHQDEKGANHLQTQKVNYHTNSRGRVEMATGACQKEALIKLYGSEEELNKRLDLLQAAHDQNDKNKKIGQYRTDAYYWVGVRHGYLGKVNKTTSGKRRMRMGELYRIEQMHELERIALETAKQYNVNYTVTNRYTTDGVHKTATAYMIEHKTTKHAKKTVATANKIASDTVAHADSVAREKLNKINEQQRQNEVERNALNVEKDELEKQKIQQAKQQKLIKLKQREQAERDVEQNRREDNLNSIWDKVQEQVNLIKNFVKRTVATFGLSEKYQNNIANQTVKYGVPLEKGGFTKEKYTGSDWALKAIHENPKLFTREVVKDLTAQDNKKDDGLEL